jgi:hypothetical protein
LKRAQLEFLLKNNEKSIKLKKFEQTVRGSSFLPSFSLIVVNDVAQDFVLCNKCRSETENEPIRTERKRFGSVRVHPNSNRFFENALEPNRTRTAL